MRKILLPLAFVAPLLGAADLAGTWHFEQTMPGPAGQPPRVRQQNYVFKADGNHFTGTSYSPTNRGDVIDGSINGDSITFKVHDEWGNNAKGSDTEYKGTLNGDELTVEPA